MTAILAYLFNVADVGALTKAEAHAMINWLQQEAQRAIYQPTPDLVRSAGYAAGCRAGWLMAKSLSRHDAPPSVDPEQTSPTADAHLDHHQP
jgi:hypothetical protein